MNKPTIQLYDATYREWEQARQDKRALQSAQLAEDYDDTMQRRVLPAPVTVEPPKTARRVNVWLAVSALVALAAVLAIWWMQS